MAMVIGGLLLGYGLLHLAHPGYHDLFCRGGRALWFGLWAWAGFVWAGTPVAWPEVGAVVLAYQTTYIANAFWDQAEDRANGRFLCLSAYHHHLALILGWITVLLAGLQRLEAGLLLAIATLAGLAYHHPRTRWKRFGTAQVALEGLAGAAVFALGWGWQPGAWLAGALMGLGAVLKDLPDLKGDQAAGHRTWMLLATHRWGVPRVHHWARTSLSLLLALLALVGWNQGSRIGPMVFLVLALLTYIYGLRGERWIWVANSALLTLNLGGP